MSSNETYKILGVRRAGDFQASQALHYQASSQAKPRLDFEVQASSLIQAFATLVFRYLFCLYV